MSLFFTLCGKVNVNLRIITFTSSALLKFHSSPNIVCHNPPSQEVCSSHPNKFGLDFVFWFTSCFRLFRNRHVSGAGNVAHMGLCGDVELNMPQMCLRHVGYDIVICSVCP